ncbi:ACP S-malonyltransferase [Desulfoluna spongiiphila]|uniref:ACP S-malonyltransferase n=1 Tax=Desulfoluna spongiiphila TaxID=419481 RepID=UPI001257974E|nr:ACP S-malonyltransferase [Desulfoluna spongiiphila]VVS93095.1 malonyl coa-acyl carrier protein transacylase [Desulfoluna spongiiphila]
MTKTVFLFPGQGSQAIGMGEDFYQEFAVVREVFEMADEITKSHLTRLCFKGPMDELTQTVNLQPAVTAVNLGMMAALAEVGGDRFEVACGHSLGEYAALCAAGVVSPEDTLTLVKSRGELMDREARKHKGAMAAVLNLDFTTVDALAESLRQEGAPSTRGVWAANHNGEKQIVVSGDPDSVKQFGAAAREKGGRAVPLRVSGAWHSPLIQGAEEPFRRVLDSVSFNGPAKGLLFNVTADAEEDPAAMKENMARQLVCPVRWYDTMTRLLEDGVTRFVEVGPGKVLSGIARKIIPQDGPCEVVNISTLAELESWMNTLG